MHSRSQMTKQNFEACTVGAKMAAIKVGSLARENLRKELDRMKLWKIQEKDWMAEGPSPAPEKPREKVG